MNWPTIAVRTPFIGSLVNAVVAHMHSQVQATATLSVNIKVLTPTADALDYRGISTESGGQVRVMSDGQKD